MNGLIAGITILVLMGAWLLYLKKATPPTDYSNPDKMLAEVDILLAFGDEKQAITILEKAQAIHEGNVNIVAKLHSLKNEGL